MAVHVPPKPMGIDCPVCGRPAHQAGYGLTEPPWVTHTDDFGDSPRCHPSLDQLREMWVRNTELRAAERRAEWPNSHDIPDHNVRALRQRIEDLSRGSS